MAHLNDKTGKELLIQLPSYDSEELKNKDSNTGKALQVKKDSQPVQIINMEPITKPSFISQDQTRNAISAQSQNSCK